MIHSSRTPWQFAGTSAPTGLLTIGNVENGTTRWRVFGSGTLSSDTGVVHGGSRSLAISGRTASWNGAGQDVTSRLVNGRSYTSSVWVRTQGSSATTAKATLAIAAGGTTSHVSMTPTTTVNPGGWTLLTGTVTASSSGTLAGATWYVETTSGTDGYYLDDAVAQ